MTFSGQFTAAWPVFGAANQLLAALALLSVSVWLTAKGVDATFALVPMVFMFCVTVVALTQLLLRNLAQGNHVLSVLSGLLLGLALVLVAQAGQGLLRPRSPGATAG